MGVRSVINEYAVDFEANTGNPPRNVYLGETEFLALLRDARDYASSTYKDVGLYDECRPKVNGMHIYRVDSVSHIAFS